MYRPRKGLPQGRRLRLLLAPALTRRAPRRILCGVRTETTPQRATKPPLLIGEAPPRAGLGPLGPFDCASGDTIARLLTEADPSRGPWDRARALGAFERRNLLGEWPGPDARGRGSALPRGTARAAAAALLASGEVAGRRVVLAGSRVADAFRALLPLGSELRWQGATWLQVPHPSGLTQDYNRAEVRREAGRALLRWVDRCAAEQVAEVRIASAAWYHFGRGQFRGDLDQARRALEAATLRVFRWCATSPVSDRAHEPLAALRAYLRCIALGLGLRVALRSAGVALIHDRHEPLAGDMASPVKPMLADDWRPIEQAAAAAVADLYAGCAPDGSLLRPLPDPGEEAAARREAHAADLDCAAIEAAWWHPTASDRVQADPLCGAARRAPSGPTGGSGPTLLHLLEVAAAGLDRAAWRGPEDLRAALDALAREVPALPLPGGEVALAR